ncbi:MAG: methionyl-tRNA formyltransferase [Bacteroidales bacterium]|nr:methionyl-tRNA formyltransferase [Bacteroidales bacterium]
MKDKPRIIFFGTPAFAVDPLDILIREGYDMAAVVTAPDKPAGRGQKLQSSPVKDFAVGHGIPVLQPVKLKEPLFINTLQNFNADLFVVVAFRMLPEAVWQMPPLGTFNLHASLLPQYRGAAPINHAIINGETETGLTTFFLQQQIDTGEIILQEKLAIGPDETAGELHDRMKTAGAGLVLKTVKAIASGNIPGINQDALMLPGTALKPAPKIFREDCRLDWTAPLKNIYNKVRGLSPSPAAFTRLISPDGATHPVKIYRARPSFEYHHPTVPKIITNGKDQLGIAVNGGILHIVELQLAGKKTMLTGEFLKGFRLNSDWKVG